MVKPKKQEIKKPAVPVVNKQEEEPEKTKEKEVVVVKEPIEQKKEPKE